MYVDIPNKFVRLATEWHSGQSDMLYAVSSTGVCGTGNRRPYSFQTGIPYTDEQWILWLLVSLASDVWVAVKSARFQKHEDQIELEAFGLFCDQKVNELRVLYNLEDW